MFLFSLTSHLCFILVLSSVNEAFPAVFQQKSAFQRLWEEISRHHRYLLLFVPFNHIKSSQRSMTTIHLLTVQSMLMFILALCYDLQVLIFTLIYSLITLIISQFPRHNESCQTHYDKSSCLAEKSLFDLTQSSCQWILMRERYHHHRRIELFRLNH
jgi:hypothetical protein